MNLAAIIINVRFLGRGNVRFLRLHCALLITIAIGILMRFVYTYCGLVSVSINSQQFYIVKYCIDAVVIWLLLKLPIAVYKRKAPHFLAAIYGIIALLFALGAFFWPGRVHSIQRYITYFGTGLYSLLSVFYMIHRQKRSLFYKRLLLSAIVCSIAFIVIIGVYIFFPQFTKQIGFFLYLAFVLMWDIAAFIFLRGAVEARKEGSLYTQNLSSREREVLELVLSGLTNIAIGEALFISPHTVKRHIANICDKLGVSSKLELAALFSAK